jgi:hypothetical protein
MQQTQLQPQPQEQSQGQNRRGYQGEACPCKTCAALTPEERAAKYARIQAARQQGGKTRAAQPSMQEARSAGFWATMESHPFFARKWLKHKIKAQNALRARKAATPALIAGQPAGRRRPQQSSGS